MAGHCFNYSKISLPLDLVSIKQLEFENALNFPSLPQDVDRVLVVCE